MHLIAMAHAQGDAAGIDAQLVATQAVAMDGESCKARPATPGQRADREGASNPSGVPNRW